MDRNAATVLLSQLQFKVTEERIQMVMESDVKFVQSGPVLAILTDEECMRFRQLPVSFNDMVRAIYRAGFEAGRDSK